MGSKPKNAKPDEFSKAQLTEVEKQFRTLTRAMTRQSATQTRLLGQQSRLQQRTAQATVRNNRREAGILNEFLRSQRASEATAARTRTGEAAVSTDLARRASIFDTNQSNSARNSYRKAQVTTQLRLADALKFTLRS